MTHYVIVLLLAEDKAELGVVVIGFVEFRSEDYHYPVL